MPAITHGPGSAPARHRGAPPPSRDRLQAGLQINIPAPQNQLPRPRAGQASRPIISKSDGRFRVSFFAVPRSFLFYSKAPQRGCVPGHHRPGAPACHVYIALANYFPQLFWPFMLPPLHAYGADTSLVRSAFPLKVPLYKKKEGRVLPAAPSSSSMPCIGALLYCATALA